MKAAILVVGFALVGAGIWFGGLLVSERHKLLIHEAVARPMEEGMAAAFLTIDNQGLPDRLLSVRSPVVDATLYSPVTKSGLPVQTGTSSLALDAAHIRISQLETRYADGALLPMTLTFANAGDVNVKARLSDPVEKGAASSAGLFGLGDICTIGEGEPAPQISLDVARKGDGWRVEIDAKEFTFTRDLLGLYHVPGTGHGHIYVGGMKLGRLFTPDHEIGPLPSGRHEVRVTLNTNDHRAYVVNGAPVTAFAVIEVD